MTRLLDSPEVDLARVAAVAAAVDGLRDRGATCQAYFRAGGSNVCVNAVNAGGDAWSRYSEVASRRAATGGRRMLPVIDSGEVKGRLWIAYDMGSATSLTEHRPGHLLPTATCLRVLSDVARALTGAAAEGVFAWELPPDSVFVSGKGARLGDLGTAREALAGTKYELGGDPAYVPPEVLRGQRAGERSGVYLFGALLHHLLTGGPPPNARSGPSANRKANLPASIKAIVAAAMSEDPERRPRSVSEAHDMARRALRGEPPARAREPRATKTAAAKRGTAKAGAKRATAKAGAAKRVTARALVARRATPKGATSETTAAKPAAPKAAAERTAPETARRKRAAAKTAATKHATPETAHTQRPAPETAATKPAAARPAAAQPLAARPPVRGRVVAKPVTPRRALALFGALILGAAAGLLLGGSPKPEPARAQTVTAGGLSVTVPSGRHRVDSGDEALLVRGPGFRLRARIVRRPLEPRSATRPVRLGALQAWRSAAGGLVRYSIPTSQGTLELACRMTSSRSSRPLRRCERTASTLTLRDARALPLAAAAEDSRRISTAVATLVAERDAARARLGSAATPNQQRRVAQELAETHQHAAASLHGLAGAETIEAGAREAATAYARLATSAGSGSAAAWDEASEQVSRSDAMLAEAVAAAR